MDDILTTEQAENDNSAQNVETTAVNPPKKKKGIIIAIVILVAAIVAAIIGVKLYNDKKAEEAARAAQEIADTYQSNLSLASISMLTGAADAESAGNLIKSVWYNTIFEESDPKTDKYTKAGTRFNEDFNTSLELLFSDSAFIKQINDIRANQDTVLQLMKELRNPPEGFEDAYDAVKDCYDVYLELTNLAVNPTGSLQTFSSNFNDADSNMLKKYNALQLYLD